jgi:hypothetical protein
MVVAVIGDIIVASSYCSHAQIIAENNSLVKWKLSNSERSPCAQAPKKEAASIPMAKGQGFYAAFNNRAIGPQRSFLSFCLNSVKTSQFILNTIYFLKGVYSN